MDRYSRQLLLREIGGEGQERLLRASVLVVGAGGLGSPACLYLAAAGVGHLFVADGDRVELSNLQRQILHGCDRLDQPKAESAAVAIRALNPDIEVVPINQELDAASAPSLLERVDLVVDGSDNFPTRYLLNALCQQLHKPLVSGAVVGFSGQVATFRHGLDPSLPCYRCLHPLPPELGSEPTCVAVGVLGAVTGVVGSYLALESVKELLGLGSTLAGHLLLFDGLDGRFLRLRLPKRDDCPQCGGVSVSSSLPVG
ncbi:MAG: HesA/MoeB/ThiF family protein [Magnetococcales bacterium]|nr:HesA/MoeB/ThiF family protein [Magnetococcales bacterium]